MLWAAGGGDHYDEEDCLSLARLSDLGELKPGGQSR
jgi:hypothetical protein